MTETAFNPPAPLHFDLKPGGVYLVSIFRRTILEHLGETCFWPLLAKLLACRLREPAVPVIFAKFVDFCSTHSSNDLLYSNL